MVVYSVESPSINQYQKHPNPKQFCRKVEIKAGNANFYSPPGDPTGTYTGNVTLTYKDGSPDLVYTGYIFHGDIIASANNEIYLTNMASGEVDKPIKSKLPPSICDQFPEKCYDYFFTTEHVTLTPQVLNPYKADFLARLTITGGTGIFIDIYGGFTSVGIFTLNPTGISTIETDKGEGIICAW